MKKVYRLTPALKDNLWGGNKLRAYGKRSDADRIAESWELSFTDGGEARLEDGRTLNEAFGKETWGTACQDFEFFPTLTKFIDAREKLSVQVHPSDNYALENEGQYGKTEMWYVVEAEKGAGLYVGFKRKVTKEEYEQAIKNNTLTELLNFYEVKAGESYFIPAGTIHAIGKGCLICEIQQNSNLTYRVYDYGRKDKFGNTRELHIEKAMKVLDFKAYQPLVFDGNALGECEYFHVEKWSVKGEKHFHVGAESFLCVTCVEGEGALGENPVRLGDSFFIPAGYGDCALQGELTVITSIIGE